jgi:predicted GNAT superfamily acetyltransferase
MGFIPAKNHQRAEFGLKTASKINPWALRILDSAEDMKAVEELQRQIWPGTETEIVPLHLLVTMAQNGGLVIGAFDMAVADHENRPGIPGERAGTQMIGFVYGFPGLYQTPDGPRPKHCSHQLGVLPAYREQGVGFALKRAQWQLVRHQNIDLITWTYDPLLSRNAHLNITRLGAVCSTYKRNLYGELEDALNQGLLTDRFQMEWWVNSMRVNRRLSKRARRPLDLAHYLSADKKILNPTKVDSRDLPRPSSTDALIGIQGTQGIDAIVLVEIPADFMTLKNADPSLALEWRLHSRAIFEYLFEQGFLATDFVHLPGNYPRSFYVLCHGESTL